MESDDLFASFSPESIRERKRFFFRINHSLISRGISLLKMELTFILLCGFGG